MGRKLKPSEGPAAIKAMLLQSMELADKAGLLLTSAYLAMTFDALGSDAARLGSLDERRPNITAR